MKYRACSQMMLLSLILLIPLSAWSQQPEQTQQPAKRNYAVIGMKNAEGVTVGEADIIADRLRIELFSTGKVSMMERDQMQDILKEQGFQQSGACTDEACMVEIGQLLGVERLISGSIGKLGSMFLLNFRSIHVQTGKIVKVVSKDINGSIEDVVQYLPNIASQLVDEASIKAEKKKEPVAEVIEDREEKEPEVKKEEPVVKEEEKALEEKPEPVEEEIYGKSKNKNRGGIRMSFNMFFGDIPLERYSDGVWKEYINQEDINDFKDNYYFSDVFYNKSHFRFQLNFMIKAGPFLVIDIGPGLMSMNRHFGYTYEDFNNSDIDFQDVDSRWKIIAPNISLGINFVKRFYPLKINAGFLVDVNFNILNLVHTFYESGYNISNLFYTYTEDIDDFFFKVNASFGPRVGAEIMAGQHVGFNIDFLYRYYKFEKIFEFTNDFDNSTIEVEYRFKMPGIGLSAGINFYF